MLDQIPQDWAETTGWTYTYNEETKRPAVAVNDTVDTRLTDLGAGRRIGFITKKTNPYAIIDIDQEKEKKHSGIALEIEDLPSQIQELIGRTYTERSLSGLGFHIVIRMNKEALSKGYYRSKTSDMQLSISNNFMVTTGNCVSPTKEIAFVEQSELSGLFNIEPEADIVPQMASEMFLPPMKTVMETLKNLPLDQNERVKIAYAKLTGTEYSHYDYWLTIGMALHDYSVRVSRAREGLAAYIEWSARDTKAFVSDADVEAKWWSFNTEMASKRGITFKTLFKLSQLVMLTYPAVDKNGYPLITVYRNFVYLMDKLNLKLHYCAEKLYYVTGDCDIMERYFTLYRVQNYFGYYGPFDRETLHSCLWPLAQDFGWSKADNIERHVKAWCKSRGPKVNIFWEWLNADESTLDDSFRYSTGQYIEASDNDLYGGEEDNEEGGEKGGYNADEEATTGIARCKTLTPPTTDYDSLDYLCSLITLDELEEDVIKLRKQQIYATFMGLIKLNCGQTFENDGNAGMLAFIGPENCGKTTFFNRILPRGLSFLRHDVVQMLKSEKNQRDFLRQLGSKVIVQVDEFEGFMDQKESGAFFKNVISGNLSTMVDIHRTDEVKLDRTGIIVGTSNEKNLLISQNGSRRLFYIPVDKIDAAGLLRINWHKFYNRLYDEFKREVKRGKSPWLLSPQAALKTTQVNSGVSAQTNLALALSEAYPYKRQYAWREHVKDISKSNEWRADPRYCRLLEINAKLELVTGQRFTLAALRNELKRFCKKFIRQQKEVILPDGKVKILNGSVYKYVPSKLSDEERTVYEKGVKYGAKYDKFKKAASIVFRDREDYWIMPTPEDNEE